jgi:membrane protein DedA with SNARE-associated domain
LFGIEDRLVEFARDLYDAIGWPGVAFLMAVESAAIPFPSEIIMPLAGWFLVKDKGHGPEYLLFAGLVGAIGNTIGSLVAYYAGLFGGRPLVLKYGKFILITPKDVDWADRWFQKYGEITVFATRMLPVIRTFISVPAGVARMNVWRFTIFSFLGAYPWCLGLAWAGYLMGEHWEDITGYFRPFTIPIVIVVTIGVVYFFYHRIQEIRHYHAEEDTAAPS